MMKALKRVLEKVFYNLFSTTSGEDDLRHFEFIQNRIPTAFKNRRLTDLGCGNGENTVRLRKAFAPSSVLGLDAVEKLVNDARLRHGIEARCVDLDREPVSGDLGTLWGSLHHFREPREALRSLRDNFESLVIREKVSRVYLELGNPFTEASFRALCNEILGDVEMVEYNHLKEKVLFCFWQKRRSKT